MAVKFTQCYEHTPGDKPYHEDDLLVLAILFGVVPGAVSGLVPGLITGFGIGGPLGLALGPIVGLFITLTVGIALALKEAAYQWRYRRLVCLSTDYRCAVGIVNSEPEIAGLGDFDNDEFFDLRLMPHPPGTPSSEVHNDGFQGTELLKKRIDELPFEASRSLLHCEAEGDFWVRMDDNAVAIAMLIALLVVATLAAAVAAGISGAVVGCMLGLAFGPAGCIVGGVLGFIFAFFVTSAVGATVSFVIAQAILQEIFDAAPGEVENANIGDSALGPIRQGDKVVVFGEHVYDGFHDGWHEIHPLVAVVKLGDQMVVNNIKNDTNLYLEQHSTPPIDLSNYYPIPPSSIWLLTENDMKTGLASPPFKKRAVWLRDEWCRLFKRAFDAEVTRMQKEPSERWTIHPLVDGCLPKEADTSRRR